MAYPNIPSRRIPYDINGSEVGIREKYNSSNIDDMFGQGSNIWADSQLKRNLNSIERGRNIESDFKTTSGVWFYLTELTEITHIAVQYDRVASNLGFKIEGSKNSTNGMDGDWETPTYAPIHSITKDSWRKDIYTVSFSSPVKVIRIGWAHSSSAANSLSISNIHLYGFKASTETPDDILFCDKNGNNLTQLMDWGDRPEGTTNFKEFKLKNSSTNKVANNINMQLNHNDFLMSFNHDGPWTSVLDIESLGPRALSPTIYLKNELPPPLLQLGPEQARIITSVGSWD